MNPRQWARDLGMGARFAVTGGREGWVRMTLTAVGVGLGVALLLLCTALPHVFAARHRVEEARYDNTFLYGDKVPAKADDTFLISEADTTWHDDDIRGRIVEPEGKRAPLPPGVSSFPAKGEMVVSPRSRNCSPPTAPDCCGSGCPTRSPARSARADSSAPTNWPSTRARRG